MKRFLTLLSLFFGGFLFLLSIGVASLLLQLSRGPLNLDFLKSTIIENILPKADTLDFKTLQLSWDSLNSPIRVQGLNLHHAQGQDKDLEVFLKKIECQFDLKKILKLQIIPEKIIAEGGTVIVNSFEGQISEDRYKADLSFQIINNFLKKIINLKKISLTESTLEIRSQKTPITFDVSVHLSQASLLPVTIQGQVLAKNKTGRGQITGDIFYEETKGDIDVNLTIADFDSQTLDDAIPQLFLQDLTFTDFSSTLSYHYALKTGTHVAYLKGKILGLDVTQSAYWNAPLLFPELRFEGELKSNTFTIKGVETSIQGIPMSISTLGTIDERKDQIYLETHVMIQNTPFKELEKIWPKGVANAAREWITENITGGFSPKTSLVMESHLDFSAQKTFFTLCSLSGTIDVQDALLSYVQTMPKIKKLKATAHFDQDHFDIHIKSGETHGLKLTSGNLFIGKFSDTLPHLALDVNIAGNLGEVLSLIDHKPLEYAKGYGLNPKTSKGQTQANLKMTFPLSSPFHTEQIETTVQAKVTNATLENLANLDVRLSKGNLDIDVGMTQLDVKGSGLLNGEKSQLTLSHKTKQERIELTVQSTLSPLFLCKIWPEANVFFKGVAPLTLHYQKEANKKGILSLNLNLKEAELNTLVYKKDFGVAGTLSLKGFYEQGTLQEIETISFKDEKTWEITGAGHFSQKEGRGSLLNLIWSQHGKDILKATYVPSQNGTPFLDLTANQIDLKNLINTNLSALSNSRNALKNPVHAQPIRVQFDAQKVVFGKELGLLNNKLTLRLEKGLVQNLSYTGETEEGVQGKRDVFAQIYQTKKRGVRKLRIQTEQGGALLRALDVFDNIRGGKLKLLAYHDTAFQDKEWVGKLKVRDFVLLKAPLITRIFSLLPTAGAELTSGKGMKFQLMKMRFGVSSKAFKIHASRAHGISIGFNLSGEIGRGDKGNLNLQGTMIPLYFINTLVSKIPLIGEVISGGRNEGLFSVSFYVAGQKDKPKISANPFSIITPGITRNIFPSPENSLMREDHWIDEDDKEGDVFDQEFNER